MRHPTRFSFPAALLVVFALIACSGAASASSTRPLAAAVNGGVNHTCALTRAGAVKCWGDNSHDELGSGRALTHSVLPVDVASLRSGVTAISVGTRHSCAVTSGGGARCWGANYGGALGDGTTDRHYAPVAVSGLGSGVASVSAGYDSSCALLTTGAVKCWGTNGFGRLGDGTDIDRPTPVDVVGLGSGVIAISTGNLSACALTAAGGVKCWGLHYGFTPTDVPGLTGGVTALSTGVPACFIMSVGSVKCLDTNWTPVDVPGLGPRVKAVSREGGHTCVLTSAARVKCWGSNEHGQLGDGTTADRAAPVDVIGLSDVTAISAGPIHTCAVTRTGGIKCWGLNSSGMLGDGTEKNRLRPVDVVGFGSPPLRCVVPNVVGKRLARARLSIVRAHCRVGTIARVASTRSKNVVARQTPRPGKRLQAGSKVDLIVSRG